MIELLSLQAPKDAVSERVDAARPRPTAIDGVLLQGSYAPSSLVGTPLHTTMWHNPAISAIAWTEDAMMSCERDMNETRGPHGVVNGLPTMPLTPALLSQIDTEGTGSVKARKVVDFVKQVNAL